MKKTLISIIGFSVIAVLVGCLTIDSSRDSQADGYSGPGTGSQANNNSSSGTGNQANNGSRVTPARLSTARNDPTKTDAQLIADAIKWGDCAFLYEYTQKKDADRQLVTQANNAIRRYTTLDSSISKYRTGKMEARVRRVPQDLMEKVFKDPETVLPAVVSSLTAGISDQFLKAKTLHDWICDNIAYDTGMYFSGRVTAQDYISVLKKKLAVCSGYSNLFNQMCKLAGIESIGINGYSKGFGYTGKIGNNTNHAWNAVNISNKWYLIDVTWDAGSLDQKTYIKEYSTEWLFLDSRPFLYSHLPEEDAYQYYAPALTADDFMREPYVAGIFFQYGLSLKTNKPEYNNVIDGTFTFDIGLSNTNTNVLSELRTLSQQGINAASWVERKGNIVTVEFDVPDTNEYKGHIFARYSNEVRLLNKVGIAVFEQDWLPRAEQLFKDTTLPREKRITEAEFNLFKEAYYKVQENNMYYFAEDQFDTAKNNAVLKVHQLLELVTNYAQNVLSFNIKAASGYRGFGKDILKYPLTFTIYNQLPNTQLISPVTGTLKAGSNETFVVSSRDYSSFAIIINGEWNMFTRNSKTGNYELNLTIPANVQSIQISGGTARNSTHWGLVRYNVVQ
jgi:transglutaminase-like putative cysteine protease